MVAVAESSSSTRGCDCLAHRFGNAADRPDRRSRYGSDMSDAEWGLVRDLLPVPSWLAGRGGRPEGYCHRQMIDAVRYLVDNGIKWRAMPSDFPPWPRVYAFFSRWRDAGLVTELHERLREAVRTSQGRSPEPSAAVVDSQSVKADAAVAPASRGFDAGKKVSRHEDVQGFQALPRRWVVERSFAWLLRSRRLVRDYERRTDTSEAVIRWSMIALMNRRLAARHDQGIPPRLQNRPHRRHPPPPRQLVQQRAEAPATAATPCLTSGIRTLGSERERPLMGPQQRGSARPIGSTSESPPTSSRPTVRSTSLPRSGSSTR